MVKLKRLSGEEIIKALKRMGFEPVRQRGSHVVMKKITVSGTIGCVVPMHREVATGTLHGLLKQAQITPEEFEQFV
ncbi:MAG: type II toxin-antitoxin system HicA family toxin [Chitinispirillaceae bacterium]|nr:type II toxin-antitoxin system HicA family toxin [Chitinispirillaceae bacterium]